MYTNNGGIRISDVMECVRVINYKGRSIRYKTGVCVGDISLHAYDALVAMQNLSGVDMYNFDIISELSRMLKKSNKISPAILMSFEDFKIDGHLEQTFLNINIFKEIASGTNREFVEFLNKAEKQINKLGCYIGDVKFNINNRRSNNEPNVSDELNTVAVQSYADLNNISYDEAYIGACDIIYNLVLGMPLTSVRIEYNLYRDSYVCDVLTQYEFDQVVLLCKALNYLMAYSDISFEGMGIFCHMILKGMQSEYKGSRDSNLGINEGGKERVKARRKGEKEIVSYDDYVENYEDIDPLVYHPNKNKQKKFSKEIEDFKKML